VLGEGADLELPFDAWSEPLSVDLQVDRMGEQLALRGRLRGVGRAECARCLEEFSLTLDAGFAALAVRGGRLAGDAESLAGEDYVLPHDGRALDLTDAVREQVLLSLPMVLLCRPDCAGLCLQCGANRNTAPCSCTSEARD